MFEPRPGHDAGLEHDFVARLSVVGLPLTGPGGAGSPGQYDWTSESGWWEHG